MKIIASNVAYVQRKDIDFLKQSNLKIPEFIFLKVFGTSDFNQRNDYEFVKFTKGNEIEYFRDLDWIIDYNQVKNLSEDEIISMCKNIANEINKIADKFNKMSDHKKEKHQEMITQCDLLDYKMNSLRDALWFKQGHIDMDVPVVFDYQTIHAKEKKKTFKSFFEKKKTP